MSSSWNDDRRPLHLPLNACVQHCCSPRPGVGRSGVVPRYHGCPQSLRHVCCDTDGVTVVGRLIIEYSVTLAFLFKYQPCSDSQNTYIRYENEQRYVSFNQELINASWRASTAWYIWYTRWKKLTTSPTQKRCLRTIRGRLDLPDTDCLHWMRSTGSSRSPALSRVVIVYSCFRATAQYTLQLGDTSHWQRRMTPTKLLNQRHRLAGWGVPHAISSDGCVESLQNPADAWLRMSSPRKRRRELCNWSRLKSRLQATQTRASCVSLWVTTRTLPPPGVTDRDGIVLRPTLVEMRCVASRQFNDIRPSVQWSSPS